MNTLFEDDFNEFIESKWETILTDTRCHGRFDWIKIEKFYYLFNLELISSSKLNCSTNKTENIRTISGALVLTPIQESISNINFTSAAVITRQSFDLSCSNLAIEVRASFPSTKVIYGVLLLPEETQFNSELAGWRIGLININNTIVSGYFPLHQSQEQEDQVFNRNPTPNEYSIFRLDIHKGTQLRSAWSLNGSFILDSVDKNCDQETCDSIKNAKFKIAIILGVYSQIDDDHVPIKEVVHKAKYWECSSMVIDYIRVFDLGKSANIDEYDRGLNGTRALDICLLDKNYMFEEGEIPIMLWIFFGLVSLIILIICEIWVMS